MHKLPAELAPNPARSLLPPLAVLQSLGFAPQRCLEGVGLAPEALEHPNTPISAAQELRFYRNALELSADPAIGLKLGEQFLPQHYGLFGYALMSAATFGDALAVTEKFGRLTFSRFRFRVGNSRDRAWFGLCEAPALEPALLRLLSDRDLAAARVDFSAILGFSLPLQSVSLSHDGAPAQATYTRYFGCPVEFSAPASRLTFARGLLDSPLPQRDPEYFRHLQQQCQLLLARLARRSSFVDDVRMLVLARPGYFPGIEDVAMRLGMSTRTLRRRLGREGGSYRAILDEVRHGLAREYLLNTDLPLDEVARLLAYSDPGNFSHAFRRWSGMSPSQWRRRWQPTAQG